MFLLPKFYFGDGPSLITRISKQLQVYSYPTSNTADRLHGLQNDFFISLCFYKICNFYADKYNHRTTTGAKLKRNWPCCSSLILTVSTGVAEGETQ